MQFSGCADEARCRAEAKAEGVGKGAAFQTRSFSGGYGEGDPPVPIPNTEVKPLCVDGTWLVTARESRSLPDPTKSRFPALFSVSLPQQGDGRIALHGLCAQGRAHRALPEKQCLRLYHILYIIESRMCIRTSKGRERR